LRVDEETTRKIDGYIGQIDLVIMQIPTKELCRLQESVMQEVQYRAHADATSLEVGREVAEV